MERAQVLICCLLVFLPIANAAGKDSSPGKGKAWPFGLEIVDDVRLAGSDHASAQFQSQVLPDLMGFLNRGSDPATSVGNRPLIDVDPAKIGLATAGDVRVYFVNEYASLHNTLGFNTTGRGVGSGDPLLIFPDASTARKRSKNAPLQPGDFVDLGSIEQGTALDFFLIANGSRNGKEVYSSDASANPDHIEHVLAYALADSPYLLLAFRDHYKGKGKPFDDLALAVDIGEANVSALSGVPEPAALLSLASFLGIVIYSTRRRRT